MSNLENVEFVLESEEDVVFVLESEEDLSNAIKDYDPTSSVDKYIELEVNYYITQEDFQRLAASTLGKDVVSLLCHPEYDDVNWIVLDTSKVAFPSLKILDFSSQPVKAVHFTQDCYPMLECISIEQCGASPFEYWNLDLPTLESLHFEFVDCDDSCNFGPSLSKCPKLESFNSYKLWGLGSVREHTLVLPNCNSFDMVRSDCLLGLKIWAPKLEELGLRSCHDLRDVTMLKRRPGGYVGKDYKWKGKKMSKFTVNVINTCLKPSYFNNWERVRRVYGNENNEFMF